VDYLPYLQSVLGLIAFPIIALAFCVGQRKIDYRLWLGAVGLQTVLALMLLKVSWFQLVLQSLNQGVVTLQAATAAGTSFVFGYLGGSDLPFEEITPGASYILAFRALPLIIVIGALTALLSHWKILPWIIQGLSKVFVKSLGISGAVALSGAANIFVSMIEAPLFIRDSLKKLSQSELFMVMTLGMSTVSGTVLVLYATFLQEVIPNAVGHVLTASIISVPAAIMIAATIIPPSQRRWMLVMQTCLTITGLWTRLRKGGSMRCKC